MSACRHTPCGAAVEVGSGAGGAAILPREIDLLVIGGGLAGYCAAHEAASLGADVLLIEKERKTGGATILSGGSFAFAGTPLQQRLGIEDSEELLFQDLRKVGGYENDETLVRAYVTGQRAAYDWLLSLGVKFERVFIASGQSVPRGHSRNAQEVLNSVAASAHATGRVQTRLNTSALRLLRDRSTGVVSGALVRVGEATSEIRARRGVVLTTGGFSRSESLLSQFAPRMANAQRMGGPGNTGEGLLMAWQLGAGFRDMGFIKGTFGNHPSAGPEDHFLLFPIYAGGIAVNALGQRFCDESRSYKHIGDACLDQPGSIGYQIFDQRIFEQGRPGIPSMDFQADLDAGRVVCGQTLGELGGMVGLEPAALERTVADYNAAVSRGHDAAFGRDSLCNHYGKLVRIEAPPFYAFPSRTVVLATYCGITVDASARVMDVYGEVIPHLFAAGGNMGGFHGQAYMTGTANGKAVVFGRIAAQSALTEQVAQSDPLP
jgi:fumarate reductase flavoprotein subunit